MLASAATHCGWNAMLRLWIRLWIRLWTSEHRVAGRALSGHRRSGCGPHARRASKPCSLDRLASGGSGPPPACCTRRLVSHRASSVHLPGRKCSTAPDKASHACETVFRRKAGHRVHSVSPQPAPGFRCARTPKAGVGERDEAVRPSAQWRVPMGVPHRRPVGRAPMRPVISKCCAPGPTRHFRSSRRCVETTLQRRRIAP